jgi:hypothetical protein
MIKNWSKVQNEAFNLNDKNRCSINFKVKRDLFANQREDNSEELKTQQ